MMKTNKYLEALKMEKAGYWDIAHEIVQDINTKEAAWIHAYLHRAEGDPGNAAYWYLQASKPKCSTTLEEEWAEIFGALKDATS